MHMSMGNCWDDEAQMWLKRAVEQHVRKSEMKMNHFPTASKFSKTQLTLPARNMAKQQQQQRQQFARQQQLFIN